MALATVPALAAAGYIQMVTGEARVWERGGSERPAQNGIQLYEGDSVTTGSGAKVQIRLSDETLILVHPDSRLQIEAYLLTPNGGRGERAVLKLIQGALRTVTGMIGKRSPNNFSVNTLTATIGIRGTDFETAYLTEAGARRAGAAAGTYARVYSGSIFLNSAAGKVAVNENQAAYAGTKPGDAPAVLKEIPEFLRNLERPAAAPASNQEIINLRHRSADYVLPLVKPLAGEDVKVSGSGNRVIVAGPAERRAELRAAIERLDAPPRRLMVTVRFDKPAGSGEVRASTRDVNEEIEQRIQALDGQRAYFYVQRSEIPRNQLIQLGAIMVLQDTRSPPSGTLLEFVPRVTENRVQLDFSLQRADAIRSGQSTVRQLGGTLNLKIGEWSEIGSQIGRGADDRQAISSSRDVRRTNDQIFIKVDELK